MCIISSQCYRFSFWKMLFFLSVHTPMNICMLVQHIITISFVHILCNSWYCYSIVWEGVFRGRAISSISLQHLLQLPTGCEGQRCDSTNYKGRNPAYKLSLQQLQQALLDSIHPIHQFLYTLCSSRGIFQNIVLCSFKLWHTIGYKQYCRTFFGRHLARKTR